MREPDEAVLDVGDSSSGSEEDVDAAVAFNVDSLLDFGDDLGPAKVKQPKKPALIPT